MTSNQSYILFDKKMELINKKQKNKIIKYNNYKLWKLLTETILLEENIDKKISEDILKDINNYFELNLNLEILIQELIYYIYLINL
jgi:hypothetical protein